MGETTVVEARPGRFHVRAVDAAQRPPVPPAEGVASGGHRLVRFSPAGMPLRPTDELVECEQIQLVHSGGELVTAVDARDRVAADGAQCPADGRHGGEHLGARRGGRLRSHNEFQDACPVCSKCINVSRHAPDRHQ